MEARMEAVYRLQHVKNPAILATPEDVDAMIDSLLTGPMYEDLAQIHSLQRPVMSSGYHDHELLLGVNSDLQVGLLAFMDSTGNVVTLGPPSENRGEVIYCLMEHARDFQDRSEVPLDLVRQAVKEFLASGGQRPTCVEWQAQKFW